MDLDVFDTKEKTSGSDTSKLDKSYGSKDQVIEFSQKNNSEYDNQGEEVNLQYLTWR